MVTKFVLAACAFAFLLVAIKHPLQAGRLHVDENSSGKHLRLLSWNIGNGDLEKDSRAHNSDLPAIAKVITDNNAEAIALQELTGEDQLKLLLKELKAGYRGSICKSAGDRFDAVLVKTQDNEKPQFRDLPAAGQCAAAASFHLQTDSPQITLVSAHADAFNAERRRKFVDDIVEWASKRPQPELVFIAGDLNLEVGTKNYNHLFTDNARHDSETYSQLLKSYRDLGFNAGETAINDRRIDYIFGPPTNVRLHNAEVLRGSSVGQMDHWPLLIEVSF